jgi:uncharacterized membrane protein
MDSNLDNQNSENTEKHPETANESEGPVISSPDRLNSALAYPTFGIWALILLFVKKGDKEVQFNARNALFLWVTEFIVIGVLGLFWFLGLGFLIPIVKLGTWLYSLYLAKEAYMGNRPNIPFITEFMQKTTSSWNV